MKKYQINIKEIKSANYNIEAKNIAEAKAIAYWRLHTQTRPSIQPKVSFEINHKKVKI
tara:strand:+ start:837 stop:1010 length:174 start_codon:yes stop_codon:yes gene_type:complete